MSHTKLHQPRKLQVIKQHSKQLPSMVLIRDSISKLSKNLSTSETCSLIEQKSPAPAEVLLFDRGQQGLGFALQPKRGCRDRWSWPIQKKGMTINWESN